MSLQALNVLQKHYHYLPCFVGLLLYSIIYIIGMHPFLLSNVCMGHGSFSPVYLVLCIVCIFQRVNFWFHWFSTFYPIDSHLFLYCILYFSASSMVYCFSQKPVLPCGLSSALEAIHIPLHTDSDTFWKSHTLWFHLYSIQKINFHYKFLFWLYYLETCCSVFKHLLPSFIFSPPPPHFFPVSCYSDQRISCW